MHWAAAPVALGLLLAACTNGGGRTARDASEVKRKTDTTAQSRRPGASAPDEEMVVASPDSTPNRPKAKSVTGRELLQANRARFTRPLPTVVSPTATTTPTTTPSTTPTTTPGNSGGTGPDIRDQRPSQEIIATAYKSGKINYSKYLLYRAYALFWDPRLPATYDGTGSLGEDDFFTEARLNFGSLDAETQTALAPFLARPADPDGYGCPLGGTWTDSGTASAHFKVWACSTNGATEDIGAAVAMLDNVYPAMTAASAMGAPVPDEEGGDPRIDVYLLDTISTRERSGQQRPIDGTTIAAVSPDAPFAGNTASSYIMIGRPRIGGDRTEAVRTAIHEFFHSLEYAHNYALETTKQGIRPWWYEATAAWAEWQFAPSLSATVHEQYFTGGFRTAPNIPLEQPTSVMGTDVRHPRWAYIWPFFMQQERGGDPAPVFDAWRAADTASDWNELHAAVDAQLPFANAWRDFAVRNLNLDLGAAFEPHYSDLDPNFPQDLSPVLNTDVELTAPGTRTIEAGDDNRGLDALTTQYDLFGIGDNSGIRSIALDFSALSKGLDVTLMTEAPDGTWTRHDYGAGDSVAFDFDRGDEITQFFVIVGNPNREPNWDKPGAAVAGGSYTVAAS